MNNKILPQKEWTEKPDSAKLIYLLKKIILSSNIPLAIRKSFDDIYEISGQSEYKKLTKSDKCYFGNIVEKHILKALGLKKNIEESGPDTNIEGISFDIKSSSSSDPNNKMPKTHQIPRKHVGEHILLICCNDYTNKYQIGVLKADRKMLKKAPRKRNSGGPSQDGKRGINALGYASAEWLAEGTFPKNQILNITLQNAFNINNVEEALQISKVKTHDVFQSIRSFS